MSTPPSNQSLALKKLTALNRWLAKVYRSETRLSEVLKLGGMAEDDIIEIKDNHMSTYVEAVLAYISANTEGRDGLRRNTAMVRHWGLQTGEHETLQSLGNELNLSRERVRQLVDRRVAFYRRGRGVLTQALLVLAYQTLGKELPSASVPILLERNASQQPVSQAMVDYLLGRAAKAYWSSLPLEQRSAEHILQGLAVALKRVIPECHISETEFVNVFRKPRRTNSNQTGAPGKSSIERLEQVKAVHPNAYAKWTPEDDKVLEELFRAGSNAAELGQHFQRQKGAITSRLRKLGLVK